MTSNRSIPGSCTLFCALATVASRKSSRDSGLTWTWTWTISMALTEHTRIAAAVALVFLAGCQARRNLDYVTLTYSEKNEACYGCPSFHVDLMAGGHGNLY